MLADGWTPDGDLWIAYRLPSAHSLVIGIPRSIGSYLMDREFEALAVDGSNAGTIVVSEELSSWGYGPYLSRRGADDGDVLIVTFDLLAGTARLTLDNPEVLDDEEESFAFSNEEVR